MKIILITTATTTTSGVAAAQLQLLLLRFVLPISSVSYLKISHWFNCYFRQT